MLSVEQIKRIPEMKSQKMTAQQIAEIFKKEGAECHRETILRWVRKLKKAGYKVENKLGRPQINL